MLPLNAIAARLDAHNRVPRYRVRVPNPHKAPAFAGWPAYLKVSPIEGLVAEMVPPDDKGGTNAMYLFANEREAEAAATKFFGTDKWKASGAVMLEEVMSA